MLQIHDIRESRVFQEAKQEGLKEGEEKGMKKGEAKGMKKGIALSIAKMAAKKMSAAKIAGILDVDVAMVRRVLKNADGN